MPPIQSFYQKSKQNFKIKLTFKVDVRKVVSWHYFKRSNGFKIMSYACLFSRKQFNIIFLPDVWKSYSKVFLQGSSNTTVSNFLLVVHIVVTYFFHSYRKLRHYCWIFGRIIDEFQLYRSVVSQQFMKYL